MSDLIIINGDEEFLKERAALDEARSSLVDHVYQYEYKNINQYEEEREILVMFGGSRAFIVWSCLEIPSLPKDDDVLIVVSKKHLEDSRAKRVRNFPKLKDYDNNNQVIQWIMDEGNSLNIDLSRVAGALFVNNGKSLRKLSSEIKKLAVLSSSNGEITPEVARSIMCFSATLNPRDVVDSMCNGRTALALAFHDKLQERADETGWIIAYLQRHILQQLRLERMAAQQIPREDIIKQLGVHPFVFKKVVLPRMGLWSRSSLMSSIDTLCGLDIAHKQGKSFSHFGLELEIVRLAEEAKDVQQHRGT